MKRKQRKINAEQKVIILRELLENDRSVSQLSEEYGVNPNLIYRWKKQLFEEAVEIFKPKSKKDETKKDREIKKLKEQLTKKETAISYLLNDNIALKKNLGEI
jgi:transposase-like protein